MPPYQVLLVTPPFTQVNTPYPATAYLKGFLNAYDVSTRQIDLSLETFVSLFCRESIRKIFDRVEELDLELSENAWRIYGLRKSYERAVDSVISFLQTKAFSLSQLITSRDFLPRACRFDHLVNIDLAFGTMGITDHAKYLSTLFLEDLADFIKETIDPNFGFSRYAEKISSSLGDFDRMEEALGQRDSLVMKAMVENLQNHLDDFRPDLVLVTVPFAGNLFAALKCGQEIKTWNPTTVVAMGGGYCNTELRSLHDPRVFNYVDFICLDDGEAPLHNLLVYLWGKQGKSKLKRTFYYEHGVGVHFSDNHAFKDFPQREIGTPDYEDLPLEKYLSILEVANPMHRLWSDGRWNKLTMAHGCYWGKCTFCDISLDYIARYEPLTASHLCDRMEAIMEQTGESGFHFVDEAAPPALMRDLALEITRRELVVSWWANIRFEKAFTSDLCRLLAKSGCVAVSGGLEVASDRLLALIQKGVTIEQVAIVCRDLSEAGILVHAYLMYGFPTQTRQETIDAMEIVRQMFEAQIIQSAYWHLFTMTIHSPVGKEPARFGVRRTGPVFSGFAQNDLIHDDPRGADHKRYSEGLRWSLFNYMNQTGLDRELDFWFDFDVPKPTVPANLIHKLIRASKKAANIVNKSAYWIGNLPIEKVSDDEYDTFVFLDHEGSWNVKMRKEEGSWWLEEIAQLTDEGMPFRMLAESYHQQTGRDFSNFLEGETGSMLLRRGMIFV